MGLFCYCLSVFICAYLEITFTCVFSAKILVSHKFKYKLALNGETLQQKNFHSSFMKISVRISFSCLVISSFIKYLKENKIFWDQYFRQIMKTELQYFLSFLFWATQNPTVVISNEFVLPALFSYTLFRNHISYKFNQQQQMGTEQFQKTYN
jgi:hypothetical protein